MSDPAPGITAQPHEENLRYFDVMITGPEGSPFAGEYCMQSPTPGQVSIGGSRTVGAEAVDRVARSSMSSPLDTSFSLRVRRSLQARALPA
jgi:hypothetical protein